MLLLCPVVSTPAVDLPLGVAAESAVVCVLVTKLVRVIQTVLPSIVVVSYKFSVFVTVSVIAPLASTYMVVDGTWDVEYVVLLSVEVKIVSLETRT